MFKHDLSLQLKYLLSDSVCPPDNKTFGGRPPSSLSKIALNESDSSMDLLGLSSRLLQFPLFLLGRHNGSFALEGMASEGSPSDQAQPLMFSVNMSNSIKKNNSHISFNICKVLVLGDKYFL